MIVPAEAESDLPFDLKGVQDLGLRQRGKRPIDGRQSGRAVLLAELGVEVLRGNGLSSVLKSPEDRKALLGHAKTGTRELLAVCVVPAHWAHELQSRTIMILNNQIEARDLCFSYGEEVSNVVDGVSLSIHKGEFVALVGPNGSGKTTLLKLLLGLLPPDGGKALLFGSTPSELTHRWRVGYVPQRRVMDLDLPATVEEIVTTGCLARHPWGRRTTSDREAVDHALEIVGMSDKRNRRIGNLSGGQQQRAFIARALVPRPELLILDEPVAGVDSEAQALFRDALVHHVRDHDGSVLLVSHELGAVSGDLDRVIVIKQSIRFDGPPSELVDTEGVSLGVHAEDLPAWLEELN